MGRGFTIVDGGVWNQTVIDELEDSGVILRMASYETCYGSHSSYNNSYETYAKTAAFSTNTNEINNVVTSAKTMAPHPSNWTLDGSTPDLFATALQRSVDNVITHNKINKVSVYNVAEWAEAGPGLQPNKRDGFGYLDAVRRLTVKSREHLNLDKISVKKPQSVNTQVFPPSGYNDTYATHSGIVPPSGYVGLVAPKIKLSWTGTFAGSETVTIKVLATYADGTNAFVEKSATAATTMWLTDDDYITLIKSGTYIVDFRVYTKSNQATSTVTKSARVIAEAR
jgi:hypothetical protein